MKGKRQQKKFLDLKYLLFSGIFLSGIGGYPPPPLNEKSSCPKTLSGKGGYPPPLNGKSPKIFLKNGAKWVKISVFWPKIAVV